jgi:hypothetical protein
MVARLIADEPPPDFWVGSAFGGRLLAGGWARTISRG